MCFKDTYIKKQAGSQSTQSFILHVKTTRFGYTYVLSSGCI